MVAVVTLGVVGVAVAPAVADDPCGANSPVAIGDFIMWDSVEGGPANVPVSARIPCRVARTITFRTVDITAKAGRDYIGVTSGSFVLPAGKTSTTVTIQVLGYSVAQPPQTFGVDLLGGAFFADHEGIVTIEKP